MCGKAQLLSGCFLIFCRGREEQQRKDHLIYNSSLISNVAEKRDSAVFFPVAC